MRVIYGSVKVKDHWKCEFETRGADPDRLVEANSYPLYPICEYIKPGDRIAEIGCGLGRFLKHWHHLGFDVVGADFEESAICKLRDENAAYKVHVENVLDLSLEKGSFDVATSFGVLSNLYREDEVKKAFKNITQLVKKGGVICVSVVADNFMWRTIDRLMRVGRIIMRSSQVYPMTLAVKPDEFQRLVSEVSGVYPIRVEKIMSKYLFYKIPFFRKLNSKSEWSSAAEGGAGFRLNMLGRIVFGFVNSLFSDSFCTCYCYVFRKT